MTHCILSLPKMPLSMRRVESAPRLAGTVVARVPELVSSPVAAAGIRAVAADMVAKEAPAARSAEEPMDPSQSRRRWVLVAVQFRGLADPAVESFDSPLADFSM